MKNGEVNLIPKSEYLFLEDIQDLYLYSLQGDTCTRWANKFLYKGVNEEDYIILAVCDDNLKKIYFNKTDFKIIRKAYLVIRIYFSNDFVNLICDNKFIIKNFNVMVDGFDKVFKLELRQNFNDNNVNNLNQVKAMTNINTKLVSNIDKTFNNINSQNIPQFNLQNNNFYQLGSQNNNKRNNK